jgi:hypothetical protein
VHATGLTRRTRPDVIQRLVETGDRALIHLFVRPIATVKSNYRSLAAVILAEYTAGPPEALPPNTLPGARYVADGSHG